VVFTVSSIRIGKRMVLFRSRSSVVDPDRETAGAVF
jgi:hypothetical protein